MCQEHIKTILLASLAAYILTTDQVLAQPGLTKGKRHQDLIRSDYKDLMQPIDIYAAPTGSKKLLSLKEMYQLVKAQGVTLKVSREELASAQETLNSTSRRRLPKLDLDIDHDQSWSKTRSDSNLTDDYADRNRVTGSRQVNSSAGFTLSGSPLSGTTYSLKVPTLSHLHTSPHESSIRPERPDSGAASLSVGIALLKDNPILVESLKDKKISLEWKRSRETFRGASLKAIIDAERAFYDLIQRHLRLSILNRSLLLARALKNDVAEMIRAGEASPTDAQKAELQVAQVETEYLAGSIEYESAVEEFKNALSLEEDNADGIFPDPKVLTQALPDIEKEVERSRKEALRLNPDISIAKISTEIFDAELALARKAMLPTLNFSTSYSNSSPANGWEVAAAESLKANDRVFAVKLEFNYPLFNDSQADEVKQASVSKLKSGYALEQAGFLLEKKLASLAKRLEIGKRKLQVAQLSREISEKNLESEYEKFRVGESTIRNVIDAQSDLNGVRLAELESRIDLILGISELRATSGRAPEGVSLVYKSGSRDELK